MPSLALILERTAAAFGLQAADLRTRRPQSDEAARAQQVFALVAMRLTDNDPTRVGFAIGCSGHRIKLDSFALEAEARRDRGLMLRLDRLGVEILAEDLAAARLKLPLPADPDPAHTAARLLAGGATAATLSEDALRGLALAFLAAVDAAAGEPSTPAREAPNHG